MEEVLHQARELVARGSYYEAHEVLEEAWKTATGRDRRFLQGVIHTVVALEHFRRGNVRGARSQAGKALDKLSGEPARGGLDALAWARRVAAFVAGDPTGAPPQPD